MTLHYPLDWPMAKPRTRFRKDSSFSKKGLSEVVDALDAELRRMNAADAILSTNMGPLGASNQVLARSTLKGDDPGVSLYFKRKGREFTMTCDAYVRLDSNIWALVKTVEAMRGIERWGSSELADQAFTGFAALPAPEVLENWWDVLGVNPSAPDEVVQAAYRTLARKAHPDAGGSTAAMARLNQARDAWEASK